MDSDPTSPRSPTTSSKTLLSPPITGTLESESVAAGDFSKRHHCYASTTHMPEGQLRYPDTGTLASDGQHTGCGLGAQLPPAVSIAASPNLVSGSVSVASLMPVSMPSSGAAAVGCKGNSVHMWPQQTPPGPRQRSQSPVQRTEPNVVPFSGGRPSPGVRGGNNTESGRVERSRESPPHGTLMRTPSWGGLKTSQAAPQATTRTHLAAMPQESSQSTLAAVQSSPKTSSRILKVASPQKTVRNTLPATPKTAFRSVACASPQATARVSPPSSPQTQMRELGPALTAVRLGGGGNVNRLLASRRVGGPQVPKRLLRRRPSPPPTTAPTAAAAAPSHTSAAPAATSATTAAATTPAATPVRSALTPPSDPVCPSTPISRATHAGEGLQPPDGADRIMQGPEAPWKTRTSVPGQHVVTKCQLVARTTAGSN